MLTERDKLLAELAAARATVARLEAALDAVNLDRGDDEERPAPRPRKAAARDWPLDLREYMRYGRQMMLPQIGLQGDESRSFRPGGAEI